MFFSVFSYFFHSPVQWFMFNLHVFYSFCTSRVFVLYVYVRLTSNMSKCKVYSFIPRVPSNVHVSVLKIAFTRLKFPFHFKEFFCSGTSFNLWQVLSKTHTAWVFDVSCMFKYQIWRIKKNSAVTVFKTQNPLYHRKQIINALCWQEGF